MQALKMAAKLGVDVKESKWSVEEKKCEFAMSNGACNNTWCDGTCRWSPHQVGAKHENNWVQACRGYPASSFGHCCRVAIKAVPLHIGSGRAWPCSARASCDLCAAVVQNLDFEHTCIQGTEICRALREAGFKGVLLIRSGNDSSADEAFYKQCGADGMLSKTTQFGALVLEVSTWAQVARERAS